MTQNDHRGCTHDQHDQHTHSVGAVFTLVGDPGGAARGGPVFSAGRPGLPWVTRPICCSHLLPLRQVFHLDKCFNFSSPLPPSFLLLSSLIFSSHPLRSHPLRHFLPHSSNFFNRAASQEGRWGGAGGSGGSRIDGRADPPPHRPGAARQGRGWLEPCWLERQTRRAPSPASCTTPVAPLHRDRFRRRTIRRTYRLNCCT